MTPKAIYSKSGKGVQEASGKTSLLSRGDRAVLSAFDGRLTVSDVADRVGKPFDNPFQRLILQLERDGYIREVSAGAAPAAAPARPGAAPTRPPAPVAKPAASAAPASGGSDLDFTIAIPASPPPKPKMAPAPLVDPATKARAENEKKAQEDNMARARREAEERAQKERDRVKTEAEAKVRAETEATLRTQAVEKAKSDAEAKVRAEAEAKIKAVRDAAARVAAEAKAKAEAEMQAKLDAERARIREEADKALREAETLRQRLDEERKAREAEERKRKEEEERRRKEEEARRAREEAEHKAREAEERKRREDEERRRKEEDERRAREEAERKAREAAERTRREEDERRVREESERAVREMQDAEAERAAAEAIASASKQQEKAPAAPPASDGGFGALLADLDSFSDREDADKKAKEDLERREKEDKKTRKAREEAERKAKEEEEEARKEAEATAAKEERRRKEEEVRRAREEEVERAKREAEDRKRRERDAETAAARAAADSKSDDIGVSDDDLDMDDVKRDEEAVSKESRKAVREREREAKELEREAQERAKEREREAKRAAKAGAKAGSAPATAYRPFRRRRSWGKRIAVTLFLLLAAGVGALHVMPISTTEYEKAASEAIGRPVKLGEAHLSLYSGVQLIFDNVSVGDAKIASVRAFPELGSLLDDRKAFSRIEIEDASLREEAIGEALVAKFRSRSFSAARVIVKRLKLVGPLPLPVLEAEVLVGPTGAIGVISLRGPDSLVGKLTPSASGIDFDVTASGFTLPFLPQVTVSTFAMKGKATNDSARIESWGGASLDGAISGSANVRWGSTWSLDGVLVARGINAAVFAPALLSEGKAEGTGKFSMNDPDPTSFKGKGRMEGTFNLNKGVLGTFDLSRAIQTGGRQATGRTPFTEMSGAAIFDRGSVALRNVSFRAGAMNAGASADVTPEGALSGRIVAEIKTSSQSLRATVNIGGTVTEPLAK